MSLIDLTNYRAHPTDARYMVFFFGTYEMAVSFEDSLSQEGIFFEKDVSESGEKKRYLYAVKRRDSERVKILNNLAMGRHRGRFINDPILRNLILFLFLGALVLAFIGYLKTN
jgi:hypothetical protein